MAFQIPTSTTLPFYVEEVELDGVSFKLEFRFNQRSGAWYMTVLDPDDNVLRAGLKVVNDWGLLVRWREVDKRPADEIIPIATVGVVAPAGIDQLGEDVILTYAGLS